MFAIHRPAPINQMNLEQALKIDGWMRPQELQFLAMVAKERKEILEVGSYKGRSCRAMADNSGVNTVIYALDPWSGSYYNNDNSEAKWINLNQFDEFRRNLYPHVESGKVKPIRAKFRDMCGKEMYDFIFIDGDHRYEEVKHDIMKAKELIKPGGIIAGHDYTEVTWPGVRKAVDELIGQVNLNDSIWWFNA